MKILVACEESHAVKNTNKEFYRRINDKRYKNK